MLRSEIDELKESVKEFRESLVTISNATEQFLKA